MHKSIWESEAVKFFQSSSYRGDYRGDKVDYKLVISRAAFRLVKSKEIQNFSEYKAFLQGLLDFISEEKEEKQPEFAKNKDAPEHQDNGRKYYENCIEIIAFTREGHKGFVVISRGDSRNDDGGIFPLVIYPEGKRKRAGDRLNALKATLSSMKNNEAVFRALEKQAVENGNFLDEGLRTILLDAFNNYGVRKKSA